VSAMAGGASILLGGVLALPCRYRARVAYDGGGYAGMQYQPNAPTIQGALERVLAQRSQTSGVRVVSAGRTDAGVHARGQTVHFELGKEYEPTELERTFSRLLPPDVAVSHVERADERDAQGRQWHATYWATGKLYTYRLHSGQSPMDPMERLYRYHAFNLPLDLDVMAQAAAIFEGEHDFGAFANTPRGSSLPYDVASTGTVRRVAQVHVVDEGAGYARVDVLLQGALYKMVRNMVGALIDVGAGRVASEQIRNLLADPSLRKRSARELLLSQARSQRADPNWPRPVPAHGLTLESVFYGAPAWGGAFEHALLGKTVGSDILWTDSNQRP